MADLERSIPLDALPPVATAVQVAPVIGSTVQALAQDRYMRKGLPYTTIGRRVRYLRPDVIRFLAMHRVEGAA
ncbi:hypothetical protein A5746_01855 [Mycolicibacterium conceptionense]|nr:hypothetical protein A5638_21520 [Mycolicibacterium fortuitum]OBJ97602.1 hypothetical protein A5639_30235 [Mycolicibacterium conceptionense]OBK69002.1 hypothetical protein A5654_13765 [Mycolicibacterium fortuitum]OMB95236.1 hypothetical protein A5746_01855 [Mycolicibacterium conceptionense]